MDVAANTIDLAQFIATLLAVVVLIVGLGWLAKHLRLPERLMAAKAGRRLRVVEQLPIDQASKLAIIRFDEREYLVVLQRQNAVLIDGKEAREPMDLPAAPAARASS